MPNKPKPATKPKRSASVTANAVRVMRVATGETEFPIAADGKNLAAVMLGRKGGAARAEALSAKRRSEIAKKAAKARWGKPAQKKR